MNKACLEGLFKGNIAVCKNWWCAFEDFRLANECFASRLLVEIIFFSILSVSVTNKKKEEKVQNKHVSQLTSRPPRPTPMYGAYPSATQAATPNTIYKKNWVYDCLGANLKCRGISICWFTPKL